MILGIKNASVLLTFFLHLSTNTTIHQNAREISKTGLSILISYAQITLDTLVFVYSNDYQNGRMFLCWQFRIRFCFDNGYCNGRFFVCRTMTALCFVCNLPILSHQVGLVWQGGNGWDDLVREQVSYIVFSFPICSILHVFKNVCVVLQVVCN